MERIKYKRTGKIYNRFFIKNLFVHMLPSLLSILLLGGFSIYSTNAYVTNQLQDNSMKTLTMAGDSITMILDELDSVSQNLSANSGVLLKLKRAFANEDYFVTHDIYETVGMVIDILFSTANSSRYIDSLYMYFDNPNQWFINSVNRMVKADNFYDRDWIDVYDNMAPNELVHMELRPVVVGGYERIYFTIYRKIHTFSSTKPDGVLVLNVDVSKMNRYLDDMLTWPFQHIVIVDEHYNPIFQSSNFNGNFAVAEGLSLQALAEEPADTFNTSIDGKNYIITKMPMEHPNWQCIQMIPRNELYRLPNMLMLTTVALLLLCFGTSVFLSFRTTHRNITYLYDILHILSDDYSEKAADRTTFGNDLYGTILHNILDSFAKSNQLRKELAEQQNHIRALGFAALQAQINPHFINNTLETIYWKTFELTGSENPATDMLESLSRLLDFSLNDYLAFCSLQQEVEMCKNYLYIQGVRFRGKFHAEWVIDCDLSRYRVIKFILQPIVENCIHHAIPQQEGSIGIRIRIFVRDDVLRIRIIDNGCGIERAPLDAINKVSQAPDKDQKVHIGISNTNERIRYVYGNDYGLRVYSHRSFGTAVSIRLPADPAYCLEAEERLADFLSPEPQL